MRPSWAAVQVRAVGRAEPGGSRGSGRREGSGGSEVGCRGLGQEWRVREEARRQHLGG